MNTLQIEMILNRVIAEVSDTSTIVDLLFNLGYNNNLELVDDRLRWIQNKVYFDPRDFQVDHIFQIDGMGYIYGLSNPVFNFKGILVIYLNGEVLLK